MQHWDDLDGYMVLMTYMLDKDNTVGANWVWAHSDGNCPSLGSGINVDDLNFHNVGIHGNGSIAGLTYGAEADIQFGKVKDDPLLRLQTSKQKAGQPSQNSGMPSTW